MDKKMTSGEIAKKAGISQKAVRLYDEKGLLKPSEHSEGNYRLYDKEALLILEKIIALKKLGFSLEEIHDNLIAERNMDITTSLKHQIELMEAKKCELERTIGCIKSVLARERGQADWNSVAEIARMIQMDQRADEGHFRALKHTADTTDWYVRIYNSLELKNDSRVLDFGCGYGKLWRNNWTDIPENVVVDGFDLHGSWADDFAGYIEEHKAELSKGTDISIHWNDVEEEETWNILVAKKPYTYIIAHYLLGFLKNKELFIQRVAAVLKAGGMFSCNGYEVNCEEQFWKQIFDDMGADSGFVSEKMAEKQKKQDEFRTLLEKYFTTVDKIKISSSMKYENSDELFERLCERYPEKKKYFTEKENMIKSYFTKLISEQGEIIIPTDAEFWHCYK